MRKFVFLTFTVMQSLVLYADVEGNREFQGEFLYFKPTSDQPYFAIPSSNNFFGEDIHPSGERQINKSSYHLGGRLEGIFDICNCIHDFDLRFTFFQGGHTSSAEGPFLFDTIGFPGNGSQAPEDTAYRGASRFRETFKFFAVDVGFNRLTVDCLENFNFLAGIHYAYIDHKDRFRSAGTYIDDQELRTVDNYLARNSHFWGIGPQLGLEYLYRFGCGVFCGCETDAFFVKIAGRGALLASNTHGTFYYETERTGPSGVDIDNESTWRVTPYANTRLSLGYDFCYRCVTGSVELGYELLWYSSCIDSIVGYDVAFAGDTFDLYSNLSLQGPFLAIRVNF